MKVTILPLISVLIVNKKKSFSCPGICASFDLNKFFTQLGNKLLLSFHINLPIVNSLYESKFNILYFQIVDPYNSLFWNDNNLTDFLMFSSSVQGYFYLHLPSL